MKKLSIILMCLFLAINSYAVDEGTQGKKVLPNSSAATSKEPSNAFKFTLILVFICIATGVTVNAIRKNKNESFEDADTEEAVIPTPKARTVSVPSASRSHSSGRSNAASFSWEQLYQKIYDYIVQQKVMLRSQKEAQNYLYHNVQSISDSIGDGTFQRIFYNMDTVSRKVWKLLQENKKTAYANGTGIKIPFTLAGIDNRPHSEETIIAHCLDKKRINYAHAEVISRSYSSRKRNKKHPGCWVGTIEYWKN